MVAMVMVTLRSDSFIEISAEHLSCSCSCLKHNAFCHLVIGSNVAKSKKVVKTQTYEHICLNVVWTVISDYYNKRFVCERHVKKGRGPIKTAYVNGPECYTAASEDIIYIASLPLPPPHSHGNFWLRRKKTKLPLELMHNLPHLEKQALQ